MNDQPSDADTGLVVVSTELLDEARKRASSGVQTSLLCEVCGQDDCGGQLSGQWIKDPGKNGESTDALILRCNKNRQHTVKVQVRRSLTTHKRP